MATVPIIPDDMRPLLRAHLLQFGWEKVRDFVNEELPILARKYEGELNREMERAKEGDSFLSTKVIRDSTDTITVFKEFTGVSIPGLPNLTISVARLAFTVERKINLTDKSKPIFILRDRPYFFAIEVAISRSKSYRISLAGGEDEMTADSFKQYRVEVEWKVPAIYFRGFLASGKKGGFLLDVEGRWPVAIPLGATMLGLQGVGLIYGEKFAPKLDEFTTSENAIEKIEKATAASFVNWSKKHDLAKWILVAEDLRTYGVSATIVDLGTGGSLVELGDAGISYLSFGPTVIIGGNVRLLDLIEAGEITGAIDIRSQSLFLRMLESFSLIPWAPDIAKFDGSVEVSASLLDQANTWVAIGGYAMDGCRIRILEFLDLKGGARLTPFRGQAIRASARVSGEGTVCGFGGGYSFWLDLIARLGWNPIEIGGELTIGGSAWIKVFGKKLGLGVSAKVTAQLPEPLIFKLDVVFTLELPWPMSDLHFPVKIFDWERPKPSKPASPLKITPQDPLSFIHGPSGTLGMLSENTSTVWPDVSFVAPMQRIAGSSPIIVNRLSNDGSHNEGGISVSHHFDLLEVKKVDLTTGNEVPLPDVRACWLLARDGTHADRTSRLAIPCNDPVAWLNTFNYAQPSTSKPAERPVFQTFGLGLPELIETDSSGFATKRFEEVVISSTNRFWIQLCPWLGGYERAIVSKEISLNFSAPDSARPLPVNRCDIRVVCNETVATEFTAKNGQILSRNRVRDIGAHLAEWSITIERDDSDQRSGLVIHAGRERDFHIVAVGYLINAWAEVETPPITVLTPGDYRLSIGGRSTANYRGEPSEPTSWESVERKFRVIAPPLRPYIRYSTQGDERDFGLEKSGWNPNPRGLGFGHYQSHLGLVRSRVGYLSKIYPTLWVSPRQDIVPLPATVRPCAQGTLAGSRGSQEWHVSTGNAAPIEEEFTFQIPQERGSNSIRIFNSVTGDGTDLGKPIDEWAYRVSEYVDSTAHLKPRLPGLGRIYGPFGMKVLETSAPPELPVDFDFDLVPAALFRPGWALPAFVAGLCNVGDPQAGLNFLKLLDWSGFFDADAVISGEGILTRPEATDLCALFDGGRQPLGLLLRTTEPCDWRRVEVTLVTGMPDQWNERLEVGVIPSLDGCSAILISRAEGISVRMPSGPFAMRVRFKLESEGLPRLTRNGDVSKSIEEFSFTFFQSCGSRW